MPIPLQLGRGDRMGRGPYEKSGILRDTSLPPLRDVDEKFTFKFPCRDVAIDGKPVRKILNDKINVLVELWYEPFGVKDDNAFLFNKAEKTITVSTEGK